MSANVNQKSNVNKSIKKNPTGAWMFFMSVVCCQVEVAVTS